MIRKLLTIFGHFVRLRLLLLDGQEAEPSRAGGEKMRKESSSPLTHSTRSDCDVWPANKSLMPGELERNSTGVCFLIGIR